MENVRFTKIGWEVDTLGNRTEWEIEEAEMPILNLYNTLNGINSFDLGDPDANCTTHPTTDVISCVCEDGFNDTTGDGLCDNEKCGLPETADKNQNRNPYIVTKNLYIKDCPGLTVRPPKTETFKDMNAYVYSEEKGDYELVDWWIEGLIQCP